MKRSAITLVALVLLGCGQSPQSFRDSMATTEELYVEYLSVKADLREHRQNNPDDTLTIGMLESRLAVLDKRLYKQGQNNKILMAKDNR